MQQTRGPRRKAVCERKIALFPISAMIGKRMSTAFPLSAFIFSLSTHAETGGVKIGAYLDPSYIGANVSYPCIYTNDTPPVMSNRLDLNFNYLTKKWRNWDYIRETIPENEKTADNGTVVPFVIDQSEMELIYGPFVDEDPVDGLIDFEDDVWARIKGIQALKEVWADNPELFSDFIPSAGYVADPVPLTDQGGLGYYYNENPDIVRRQKELAHNYGIDYFTLEWYITYDSVKDLWIDRKTAAIDVFFKETAPEKDLKLALNWIYKGDVSGFEPGAMQYLDEESAQVFADRLQGYISNSQYLKVDGKPVFFIFNAADMITEHGTGTVSNFLSQLRANLNGLTIVAYAAMNVPNAPSITAAGFDWSVDSGRTWTQEPNYVSYSTSMTNTFFEKTEYHSLKQMVDVSARPHPELVYRAGSAYYRQNQELNANGGLWGYFRQEYPGTVLDCDNTPERFRNNMEAAINYASNLPQAEQHVLIHSWNIWGEASPIEPTVRDGFKYLDAIKQATTTNALQSAEQYNNIPLYSEQFTSGLPSDWYYKTSHWSAPVGALEFDRTDNLSWATCSNTAYSSNCEIETEIKLLNLSDSSSYAGVQLCKTTPADGIGTSGYNIRINDTAISLYKCWTELATASVPEGLNALEETLHLKVRSNQGWLVVYINNTWLFSVYDNTYTSGYVGVLGNKCQARFDNFEIYPLRLN